MSKEEKGSNNNIYWSIVQGSLRTQVPENHPEVVVRHWEAGGNKGVKYERVVRALTGRIVGVTFYDGESGGKKFQNLNLILDENEEGKSPVISVGVGTRYAQDILKKLPNVDLKEEVRIEPFSFTPEGQDKVVTGVKITQQGGTGEFNTPIKSFFHKKATDESGKDKVESINGFPVPEGDTQFYTTDDWDIFYKQARRFLVNYTKENISPKFETGTKVEYPEQEVSPEDINPFD